MIERTLLKHIDLPADAIAAFCEKWHIRELALFGSVLRDDFTATSDIDVLVTFDAEATASLFDIPLMQDELAALIGRDVEIVSKAGVQDDANPYRREAILNSYRTVYVATR